MKTMIVRLVLCVLLTALLAGVSCRRTENPRPIPPASAPADSAQVAPSPSASPAPPTDPDSVRTQLLRRKGELLMARKRVYASSEMTRTQKDSALRAIEKESVELSKKLVAAGH
jgi:hypothetical protein